MNGHFKQLNVCNLKQIIIK
ncbi:unnamed protein product [Coregonus sp. 'balchen']|nr:unnamed protein product [Coregonus sp. 'balchen']